MNRRPLNILLCLICLGLGLGVWDRVTATPSDVTIPRPVLPEREAKRVAVEPIAFVALSPMADRPVFSPTRRPPQAAAPEPERAQPLPDFALSGIVLRGQTRRALLAIDNAAPVLVGPGDRVSGWGVRAVSEDAVTVEAGGRVVTVSIDQTVTVDGTPTATAGGAARATARRTASPARARPSRNDPDAAEHYGLDEYEDD